MPNDANLIAEFKRIADAATQWTGSYIGALEAHNTFAAFAREHASRLIELSKRAVSAEYEAGCLRQDIREKYEPYKQLSESLTETLQVFRDDNEKKAAAIQQLETDLAAARDRIATYRSRYGCLSCGEQHPVESMCPPHEVRTTGMAGIDEERKALTLEMAAARAEIEGLKRSNDDLTSEGFSDRINRLWLLSGCKKGRMTEWAASEIERLRSELKRLTAPATPSQNTPPAGQS